MSNIYVMQRANGDVFALDHKGRFRVPLFRSSGEAMIARSLMVEMLVFKPVALDAHLVSELVSEDGGTDVDLWLVEDPLLMLKRGRLIDRGQLALLISNPREEVVSGKGNAPDLPARTIAVMPELRADEA